MRKLLELIAVLALLNAGAGLALADGPGVSAQPNIQPGSQSSTVGGSGSASGGDAGPATVAMSEPIAASSSTTTPSSTGPSTSSTTATGPGTSASAPLNASTSEPDPSANGSVPSPTTSGPTASADATQSDVSVSDGTVRSNLIANAWALFGGGADGVGFIEDPTILSACTTAEATPGVPTDVSLGTSCGTSWSSVSEDFGANDANGNGGAGTPSGSACLLADASAGPTPTTGLSSACTAQGGATAPTASTAGNQNAASHQGATASADSLAGNPRDAGSVLGVDILPSSATEPASMTLLGTMLSIAGLVLLRRTQRKN